MNIQNLIPIAEIKKKTGDYVKDGILYCGNCKQPKQCEVKLLGIKKIVTCLCECEAKRYKTEQKQIEREDKLRRIKSLKLSGLQDKKYLNWNFRADNKGNPRQMERARRYVEKWDDLYCNNCGLLLWGDVGTGKTFFASCIANALMEMGIPVLMTKFSAIVSAMGFDDKYLRELRNYKLLIIDDLGVERQSEYMMEKIYNIIDSRYKDGQPLIVTTNLTLDEIKEPKNVEYKRIYDRILEMCVPIVFKGESKRIEVRKEKKEKLKAMFE